jgi:hypothetical protein
MLSTGGVICAEPRKQFLRQHGTLLYRIQDNLLGNRPEQEILCASAVNVILDARKSWKERTDRTISKPGTGRRYDSDGHRSWRFGMS